jgi:hypothetical protein
LRASSALISRPLAHSSNTYYTQGFPELSWNISNKITLHKRGPN